MPNYKDEKPLKCSFCGKPQNRVRKLIAGPGVYICDASPHLITGLFNGRVFGPPWSFTSTSAWTWIGHSVSGLLHTTYSPCSDLLSLRLRALST